MPLPFALTSLLSILLKIQAMRKRTYAGNLGSVIKSRRNQITEAASSQRLTHTYTMQSIRKYDLRLKRNEGQLSCPSTRKGGGGGKCFACSPRAHGATNLGLHAPLFLFTIQLSAVRLAIQAYVLPERVPVGVGGCTSELHGNSARRNFVL